MPNPAISMPLVDQKAFQPVSLPVFKLKEPLMCQGSPLTQLESSVVKEQAPSVLKIETMYGAMSISTGSDLMNEKLKKNLMEMEMLQNWTLLAVVRIFPKSTDNRDLQDRAAILSSQKEEVF